MMRPFGIAAILCVFVVGLAVMGSPRPVAAGDDVPPKNVKVGLPKSLFHDLPAPLVKVVMQPFKDFLEAQTGSTSEIIVNGDAMALAKQLDDDKIQMAVFHGFEFAWAQEKYPHLKAVVLCVNENPIQRAYLIVRQDCTAAKCCDLKDQSVAFPKMSRDHCQLFLERRCVKEGMTPAKFYAELTQPIDSENALDDVVDGTVQAAIIDGVALEAYKQEKPGRAKLLKILLESEAFPSAVIAYNPGAAKPVDPATVARFQKGLIGAQTTPEGKKLLDRCRITSFEAVPDNYEKIFADIAKAYPPLPPKK
jgi:ABC-type phosphate/phosphonate transport system substrate-binding protein